jgi:EpsD family peptidyl-prolyl cis-trans isomerase
VIRHHSSRIGGLVLLLSVSGIVLAACGQKSGEQGAASKGQVVARVGNEVVTVQELNNEFRLAKIPPDKQKEPDLLKRVLGELVLRKYLYQQAMAAKLDREPSVLLDLLRAREQVLGSAVLTRAALAKAPTSADLDQYIAKHDWKFGKRKLFSVEQIIVPLTAATQTINITKDTQSLDEIQQQLVTASVPYTRQMGELMSSDLSQELVALIAKRKDDDVFHTNAGANSVFFKIRSEQAKPVEGVAAADLALQAMRTDAVAAELGMAAYSANLESTYEGDYANLMRHAH